MLLTASIAVFRAPGSGALSTITTQLNSTACRVYTSFQHS